MECLHEALFIGLRWRRSRYIGTLFMRYMTAHQDEITVDKLEQSFQEKSSKVDQIIFIMCMQHSLAKTDIGWLSSLCL